MGAEINSDSNPQAVSTVVNKNEGVVFLSAENLLLLLVPLFFNEHLHL